MQTTRIAARTLSGALVAAAIGVAGCGSAPPPTRSQAEALAAIRSAQAVGAAEQPQAAYHLELANERMEQAQRLIADGKMPDAERVLARAKADADLAIALSDEETTRESAEAARAHIEALER